MSAKQIRREFSRHILRCHWANAKPLTLREFIALAASLHLAQHLKVAA